MIKNFINEYPYTNLTYANIDWLIKKVKELSGDTEDTDAGIQAFLSTYANEYPYSNLTYANIDWLIKNVGGLDAEVTKLSAQMETLQADVDNITTKFGDKVDKLETQNVIYATDNSTPAKTIGIQYLESPFEGTIPIRDGIGSLQVPTAQDATQAVNKGQMDTALDGKVDKTTESARIYGTDGNGMPFLYTQTATDTTLYSVPLRNENGAIVANRAQQDMELVPLIQMNTALEGKVNKTKTPNQVYGTDQNGMQSRYDISKNASSISVVQRTESGTIKAANPTQNNELTTKEYVDNAIATAPTGGWSTILDKTWTEDETSGRISIDIPAEYQKAMSELRMIYYNNTPQTGAVYSVENVDIRLYDGVEGRRFMSTNNILPTKDTKEFNVDWTSTGYNDVDNLRAFKDASGVYNKGIPTSNAMAPLNQSTITYADSQKNLDALLENRTHTVIDGTTTKTYTGTLVTDLHIEPPTTTNVTAIDFGIIEQPLTVDNITNRLTFKKGDITYTVSAVAENRYDATYTTLSGTLSPAGYFVYYVSGDSSGKWQKGRLYYTQNNDATISMDNALVVTDVSATYTTNDYYSSDNADVILSQVIGSTNGKHIGELVDFNKSITACTFKWTGETAISYKNVVTRQAVIVGESFQVIAGAESAQNTMTSFNDTSDSINGNPLTTNRAVYSYLKNGYPIKVYVFPKPSTSNGVTANKIYAGSRLVVQVKY